MSDQPNSAKVTRFRINQLGFPIPDPIGTWVGISDYEALRKERDAAQKYAALCRVQFEKASNSADAFQKQVMALEKEREELKKKLEQACDVIDAYAQTE